MFKRIYWRRRCPPSVFFLPGNGPGVCWGITTFKGLMSTQSVQHPNLSGSTNTRPGPASSADRAAPGRSPWWRAVVAAGVLLPLLLAVPAGAQQGVLERTARVEVPVYEDNLDQARTRALARGQHMVVLSLVNELVDAEWVLLFDRELRNRVFNRLDRYITSFRVKSQGSAFDRTKYQAMIYARIDRQQLIEDLRGMSLPLLSDPLLEMALAYDGQDPVLGDPKNREAVTKALIERMKRLGYSISGWQPMGEREAGILGNPMGDNKQRERVLSRQKNPVAAFLRFESLPGEEAPKKQDPGLRASIIFYHRSTGAWLGTLEHQARSGGLKPVGKGRQSQKLLEELLLGPLAQRLLPGVIRTPSSLPGETPEISVRVWGLASIEEEETFEQNFFRRGSRFEKFKLVIIGGDTLTYQGAFRGDPRTLEEQLRGSSVGPFLIRNVFWQNGLLELELSGEKENSGPELKLFSPETRPADAAQSIKSYFERYTQLEVEDPVYSENEANGWLSRANPLAFNATIYGLLDSREDSDFFVGEALSPNEELVLVWYRISRTNLAPVIRIYDENGAVIRTFRPMTWLEHKIRIPENQHRFYIEISDRYGYLRMDTGGYLNFGYLFKIKRSATVANHVAPPRPTTPQP